MIGTPKRTAFYIAAFLAFAASPALAQNPVSFDHPGTELTGKLLGSYVMLARGQMLKGQILYMEEPIAIAGNKESNDRRNRKSAKGVDKILLEFDGAGPSDDMFGGAVRVTGRLTNSPSDPFHTEVTMIVTDATLIEAAVGDQPVATFKTH